MTWRLIIIACLCALTAHAQDKQLSLDKIYGEGYFASKSVPGFSFMNDNNYYSKIIHYKEGERNYFRIAQMDLKNNQEKATILDIKNTPLVLDSKYDELRFESYELSPDEQQILLYYNGESIYRHSAKYIVYLYDRKTGLLQKVDDHKILHATLNAQGDKIVFVRDNNLYYKNLRTNITHAITRDGKWNHIINGNCDWVYEEEFSFTKAFEIAPDGNSVAFFRFDESRVPEFVMPVYDSLYPTLQSFKYPKAGEVNSEIKIIHYDFHTGATHTAIDGTGRDIYIPRIRWADDKHLCIFELNRHQNHLQYHIYNTTTKETSQMLEERNPYYIEISDQFTFSDDGLKMIYLSERDGWNRIYMYDRIKRSILPLSPGSQDVNQLLGYNQQTQMIYYTSCARDVYTQHLYAYDMKRKKTSKITQGDYWHHISSSPSLQYFMVQQSSFTSVPKYTLIDHKGNTVLSLEQNDALAQRLKEYKWGQIQKDTVMSADGKYPLYGYLIYPPDFTPHKKYPVLMYQYSGPGSRESQDEFPASGHYYWHQYLAHQGYIIACYDPRGTGSRGEAFKKATYLQLGKLESDDMIAAAQQLRERPFVDSTRIGIWGWSYGGFMAATCILKGNTTFRTAISVAPVTNWRYYDNIYTERYMRTPQENPQGYDENAPDKMAKGLQGNLLIIHGTSDDNVHFQNAAMLTKALIDERKQFESFYYPNKDHGIRGRSTRWQLYQKMTNYILEKL